MVDFYVPPYTPPAGSTETAPGLDPNGNPAPLTIATAVQQQKERYQKELNRINSEGTYYTQEEGEEEPTLHTLAPVQQLMDENSGIAEHGTVDGTPEGEDILPVKELKQEIQNLNESQRDTLVQSFLGLGFSQEAAEQYADEAIAASKSGDWSSYEANISKEFHALETEGLSEQLQQQTFTNSDGEEVQIFSKDIADALAHGLTSSDPAEQEVAGVLLIMMSIFGPGEGENAITGEKIFATYDKYNTKDTAEDIVTNEGEGTEETEGESTEKTDVVATSSENAPEQEQET